jgi:site-specific recombinase XerD
MEEYYLFMRVEKTASIKTIYAYRSDLNQLAEFLEKEGLNPFTADAISQPLIHKFLLYLGENFDYKPATLARRVNCLRSFFNFCVEQDYIMVSPMRKIKPPRIPRRIPVFLKPAELKRLLAVPEFYKADDLWLQDKAITSLMFVGHKDISHLIWISLFIFRFVCALLQEYISVSVIPHIIVPPPFVFFGESPLSNSPLSEYQLSSAKLLQFPYIAHIVQTVL